MANDPSARRTAVFKGPKGDKGDRGPPGPAGVSSIISGYASTAIAVGAITAGDPVCADAIDAAKITKATPAHLAIAGLLKGVALATVADGASCSFAGPGTVVNTGLGANAQIAWAAVVASAIVRVGALTGAEFILGRIGLEGYVTIAPSHQSAVVINVCDPRYGADPTGNADSLSAINLAMADVPAAGGTIKFPAGTFRVYKPWQIQRSSVIVEGDGSTATTITLDDPATRWLNGPTIFISVPLAVPTVASSFGGLCGQLSSASATAIVCSDCDGVRVDGRATLTIDGAITRTSATAYEAFFSSSGRRYTAEGISYGWQFYVGGSDNLVGILTVNGTQHTLGTAASSFLNGSTHTFELSYDGTTVRLFLDGVMADSQTASGPVTQQYYEDVIVGPTLQGFSESEIGAPSMEANLHFIRISSTARHVANFTAPAVKPAWDASTMWLLTFDDGAEGSLLKVKTLTGAYSPAIGYLPVVSIYFGGSVIGQNHLRDISVVSNRGTAIRAARASLMNWRNVAVSGQSGIILTNNCYTCSFTDMLANGTGRALPSPSTQVFDRIGFLNGNSCGVNEWNGIQSSGFPYGFVGINSGLHVAGRIYIYGGPLQVGMLLRGGGPELEVRIVGPIITDETAAGASTKLGLDRVESATIVGGNLQGKQQNGPCVVVDGGGSILFSGGKFDVKATATEVVQYLSAPRTPVKFDNPCRTPGFGESVPWTAHATAPMVVEPQESQGRIAVALSGSISITRDQWLNRAIELTGSPGAGFNVTIPTIDGIERRIANKTGQSATIKTAAGASFVIAAGKRAIVSCDGTNAIRETADV